MLLKTVIAQEMRTFTEKLTALDSEYEALAFQKKMQKQTEAQIDQLRSELPAEILVFYDQLRVVHKLKGDAGSIDAPSTNP